MGDQYRLVGLGNSELLAGLSSLVRQSNALSAQMLAHLVELEERMLHLELGFSSLFSYCVEALGMSEGAAGRRVAAARVCRRFPEVFARVARGELHLCALCALAAHLTNDNAAELFDACRGKTRRQVEELLAGRFPRPDVRAQIRRLPTRAHVPAAVLIDDSQPVSIELQSERAPRSSEPAPQPVAQTVPVERRRAREIEPLSNDRFGVHFTADAELRDLIERARALASHRLANGDLASLMKLMAACFVQHEEKRRFGIGTRPRRTKTKGEIEIDTAAPSTESNTEPAESEPSTLGGTGAPPGEVPAPEVDEGLKVRPTDASRVGGRFAGQRVKAAVKRGRYVSVAVRREVHARDIGRCAFVAADGRRCNARALLQFDHVEPFARGGTDDVPNIRLLCSAHNRLHARRCFGALHLAAKIAARRRGKQTTEVSNASNNVERSAVSR